MDGWISTAKWGWNKIAELAFCPTTFCLERESKTHPVRADGNVGDPPPLLGFGEGGSADIENDCATVIMRNN